MGIFTQDSECKVCNAHLARIDDLKDEIIRLVKERDSERAEYKRAIDVILLKEQIPAIGQGVPVQPSQMDPMRMLSFMDEEVKKDN